MPIDSTHSRYDAQAKQWERNRDAIEGHDQIQAKRDKYLPVPPGLTGGIMQFLDSGKRYGGGQDRYEFYLTFAEFPEIVSPAVNGFQGLVHEKPPTVELPPSMEYLLEHASPTGETLQALWENVTKEVVTTGRVGLACDVDSNDDTIRIASYAAESLINWRLNPASEGGGPEFVVFATMEERPKPDDPFVSQPVIIFTEMRMIDGVYHLAKWEKRENEEAELVEGPDPVNRINTVLKDVPVVVVNATDVGFEYGPVPVTPLTRRALSIYRFTADYRRSLYMKGDPQPWVSGVHKDDAPTEIGGSSVWSFSNPNAKAGYLDIDGNGIPFLRQAIMDEYDQFHQAGGKFLSEDNGAESGVALTKRQRSKSVTLKGVIRNAGNAMEQVLRKIAMILGEDPDKVSFVPDCDWAEPTMTGKELFELVMAHNAAPVLSLETIHELARRGGMTDNDYETELKMIQAEAPLVDGLMGLSEPEPEPEPDQPPAPEEGEDDESQ